MANWKSIRCSRRYACHRVIQCRRDCRHCAGLVDVRQKETAKEPSIEKASWWYRLSYRKFYIDELYDYVIVRPLRVLGYFVHLFDEFVVDGIVRLLAKLTVAIGRTGTRLQNGQLQTYGLVSMLGLGLLAVAFIGWRFVIHAG